MYPSCVEASNMSQDTMRGKIIFDEQVDPNEDRFSNDKFDRSAAFIEDLLSGDALDFCLRYFGMPSYEQMAGLINLYFHQIANPARGLHLYDSITGKRFLYHTVDSTQKRQLYHTVDNKKKRPLITITERMPEWNDKPSS